MKGWGMCSPVPPRVLGEASLLPGCVLQAGSWTTAEGPRDFAQMCSCQGSVNLCLLGCPWQSQLKLQVALGLCESAPLLF